MPLTQLKRTLEIATPGTNLYMRHQQLMVARPNELTVSIPIEEIGVLVLDEARCNITQSVLAKLAESTVAVVVNNSKHLPIGILLPTGSHSLVVAIQNDQLRTSEPKKKRLWQRIVQAKVFMQSCVLRRFNQTDRGLEEMVKRVLSGDTSNIEASAAQRYWKALFGNEFRRDRELDGLNSLLNYGYAIIRASMARAIVASGLLPSIGLHHHNRSNAFCLADDLMEPYRPFVDERVKALSGEGNFDNAVFSLQNREIRAKLLALLSKTIPMRDSNTPLGLAVSMTVGSLKKCFAQKSGTLILPTGISPVKFVQPVPLRSDHQAHLGIEVTRIERSNKT